MSEIFNYELLRVGYTQLPNVYDLDFSIIPTFGVYDILQHIGGAPLFSHDTHIENIYAERIAPDVDFKQWSIQFKDRMCFSDGSPLSAENWYHSIARNILIGKGVHFNPKEEILGAKNSKNGYCKGLILDGNTVHLVLNHPNRSFYRNIGKPESTVLPIATANTQKLDLARLPTSGPYRLSSVSLDRILLEINPHYPGHTKRSPFKYIEMLRVSHLEQMKMLLNKELDLIFPWHLPEADTERSLSRSKQKFSFFGETIFLSFRAERDSDWASSLDLRQSLVKKIKSRPSLSGYEIASTILQGEGIGRCGPILNFSTTNSDVACLPMLSIAAVDCPYSRDVLEVLSPLIKINVTWVNCFSDLFRQEVSEITDTFIGWNDFCATDPYIAWCNALNPERRLFFDQGDFLLKLQCIQGLSTIEERDAAYKNLERGVLESAGVIPLYSFYEYAYAGNYIDLSQLIGTCLWTLKARKYE